MDSGIYSYNTVCTPSCTDWSEVGLVTGVSTNAKTLHQLRICRSVYTSANAIICFHTYSCISRVQPLIAVVAVAVIETLSSDERTSIISNSTSSAVPIKIYTHDGKPVLVRWSSSEIDNNSKTELIRVRLKSSTQPSVSDSWPLVYSVTVETLGFIAILCGQI